MGCLPEIVPPAELPAQLVVEAPAHLAKPAAAQVAAEAVLVPVLVDGLQEIAVPDVLLAAPACQQRWGDLQHLIHRLPEGVRQTLDKGNPLQEHPREKKEKQNKSKLGQVRTGVVSLFLLVYTKSKKGTQGILHLLLGNGNLETKFVSVTSQNSTKLINITADSVAQLI